MIRTGDPVRDHLHHYRNNPIIAAVVFALALMGDDPEDCKSGYSVTNAASTVAKLFADPSLRGEIVSRLTIDDDDSYAP